MNRYVIAGAVKDAEDGKSVVLCCRHSRAHLDAVVSHATPAEVVHVSRVNGCERVDFASGGYLRLMNMGRDSLRGASVDVVFIDHDATPRLTDDARVSVMALGGELIEA